MPNALGHNVSALNLALHASPVVKFVLLVLLFASVLSWAIIIWKSRALKRARRENVRFLETFWRARSLDDMESKINLFPGSPVAAIFDAASKELRKLPVPAHGASAPGVLDNISRSLARASSQQVAEMERAVGWLATIANASPFIGLFGTVWGIMGSFQGIGAQGSASLAVVAPGISEALIATATGLAAAIPAVVAYNHFVAQIRRAAIDLEGFSQDFLNIVQEGYLRGGSRE
jgi:biopolymer transport protein TolQ